MVYPALPLYPASTTTSFDDLRQITRGQRFILNGYEHEALDDAASYRHNGFEFVTIHAKRKYGAMPNGWELADVNERRPCDEPLYENRIEWRG